MKSRRKRGCIFCGFVSSLIAYLAIAEHWVYIDNTKRFPPPCSLPDTSAEKTYSNYLSASATVLVDISLELPNPSFSSRLRSQ